MQQIDKIEIAENALYQWACGKQTLKQVKYVLAILGLVCDLRQSGASLLAYDKATGDNITLYI